MFMLGMPVLSEFSFQKHVTFVIKKKQTTFFKGNFKKKKKKKGHRLGSRNSTGPAAARGSRSCQPPGSPGKGPVSPRPLLLDTLPTAWTHPGRGPSTSCPNPDPQGPRGDECMLLSAVCTLGATHHAARGNRYAIYTNSQGQTLYP